MEKKIAVSFGLKVSEMLERARYAVNLPCVAEITGEKKMVVTVLALLPAPCRAILLTVVCAAVAAAHPRGVGRVNPRLWSALGECSGEEGGHHILLKRLETP